MKKVLLGFQKSFFAKAEFVVLIFFTVLIQQSYAQCVLLPQNSNVSKSKDLRIESVETFSCANASTSYTTKWGTLNFNIPTSTTAIKTIPVNFNIFQDNSGGNGYADDSATRARLVQIADWVNGHFQSNDTPSDPIPGVPFIADSRIRFELVGIYYYQNSVANMYDLNHIQDLLTIINNTDPNRMKQINICFTQGGSSPYGATNLPDFSDFNFNQGVIIMDGLHAGDWAMGGTIAHELGHCLNLKHTYSQDPETNMFSDPFFMDDLFNAVITPGCTTSGAFACYQDGGWNTNPYASGNTATNNLMGGTQASWYKTPKQMGKMHHALALSSVRKYVKGDSYSSTPITVTSNETWDFNVKLYSDLIVDNGAVLNLSCGLSLIDNAKIIVKNNSTVILDGTLQLSNTTLPSYGSNTIVIESGSGLHVTSLGYITMNQGASITVNSGGYLCIDDFSHVIFNDPEAKITLNGVTYYGGLQAVNTSAQTYSAVIPTGTNYYASITTSTSASISTTAGATGLKAKNYILFNPNTNLTPVTGSKLVAWIQPSNFTNACGPGMRDGTYQDFNSDPAGSSKNDRLSNVLPNPSNGNFNLDLSKINSTDGIQVYVRNGLNETVFSAHYKDKSFQNINLAGLTSGMYYVIVSTSSINELHKIVIEK